MMNDIDCTSGRWTNGDKHEVVAEMSDQLNGGYAIAVCYGPDKIANARRIVACVNSCKGISTKTLELANKHSAKLHGIYDAYEDLLTRNKELLAALKHHQEQTRPIQRSIDIIAKCEANHG